MLRKTGFKRPDYRPAPAPPPRPVQTAARLVRCDTVVREQPKRPADRSASLKLLAKGESCTLKLPGCRCHPDTTVWAHTNTQADEKGMLYKAHDSQGFFAGAECHARFDQEDEFSAD